MANIQNLKPIRSEKEAREKGKKGGIKSGEIRRKRKTLREELISLLEKDYTSEKISLSLVQQALKGNIKAFEVIRDTIGEKPNSNIEVSPNDPFKVNINVIKN